MIDAGRFAKRTEPNLTSGGDKCFFRFAISSDDAARELRRLADAVESGRILIQKVQVGQVASVDDFYLQAIMIEFAEREELENGNALNSSVGTAVNLHRDDRKCYHCRADRRDR
jgi:hypothetical protein